QVMVGKLIGVSLMVVTQLMIWGLAVAAMALYVVTAMAAQGFEGVNLPRLPPFFVIYFSLFFLLGYFMYATLYVLIGSMVTTAQEGGQMAMPVIFLLMAGLYLALAVVRSPNSSFAFLVSIVPFFSSFPFL